MIEVQHLTKTYAEQTAVDDISFSVNDGEIIGFLGPNGAGKSTTLRMLTGYLAPNRGSIRVANVDALADPLGARRFIGYMPESVPLYKELRVREYLNYRARLKGVKRRDLVKRVDAALQMANVGDVRDRIIGQLSKGYRSRVGLADALVADPPLLVLDEPTAGLDPNQIRQVRDLIRALAGTKTVLLSTHILPEVESTCDRVLIIHKGRMVGEGAPGSLRVRGEGLQVLSLEGRGEPARYEEALAKVSGVQRVVSAVAVAADDGPLVKVRLEVESPGTAEAVCEAVAQSGLPLRELRREESSLEDVFASLTTTEDTAADDNGAELEAQAAGDAEPDTSPDAGADAQDADAERDPEHTQ